MEVRPERGARELPGQRLVEFAGQHHRRPHDPSAIQGGSPGGYCLVQVAESDGGVFLGCGALHLYGPHLCEVRSIVVKPEAKSKGAGGRIVKALIEEAETHGIQSVCLFTRIPDFFFKYGFRTVEDKSELPDKIFKDCQVCPRLHRCDEVAMVRGRIPRISILGPKEEAQELVRISG